MRYRRVRDTIGGGIPRVPRAACPPVRACVAGGTGRPGFAEAMPGQASCQWHPPKVSRSPGYRASGNRLGRKGAGKYNLGCHQGRCLKAGLTGGGRDFDEHKHFLS